MPEGRGRCEGAWLRCSIHDWGLTLAGPTFFRRFFARRSPGPLLRRTYKHRRMKMETDTTYRIVSIAHGGYFGKTAATPELAKLAAGDLDRSERLGLEKTIWGVDNYGKPKALRTVSLAQKSGPENGPWAPSVWGAGCFALRAAGATFDASRRGRPDAVSDLRYYGGMVRQTPWEKIGVSRATWYRRGKVDREAAQGENGPRDRQTSRREQHTNLQ